MTLLTIIVKHPFFQIRLAALGLLCGSPRTTESVSELDLQLCQMFIPANMNNQSPSFRQQAGAQLKKVKNLGHHLCHFAFIMNSIPSCYIIYGKAISAIFSLKFLLRLKECIRISSKNVKQEKKIDEKQLYEQQVALYKVIICFLHLETDKIFWYFAAVSI